MTNHTLWRAVGIKEWRNEVKEPTANVVIEFWNRNQLGYRARDGKESNQCSPAVLFHERSSALGGQQSKVRKTRELSCTRL
jgi:hypothetical protein